MALSIDDIFDSVLVEDNIKSVGDTQVNQFVQELNSNSTNVVVARSSKPPWWIEELPRTVGQIGGAIIGGGLAGAVALSNPVTAATAPFAVGMGAAAGGGIGRGLAQGVIQLGRSRMAGQETPHPVQDIAREVGTGTVGELAGQGAGQLAKAGVGVAKAGIGKLGQFFSGISDATLEHGTATGWRGLGLKTLKAVQEAASQVADKVDAGIKGIRKYSQEAYGKVLDKYRAVTFTPITAEGENVLARYTTNLNKSGLMYASEEGPKFADVEGLKKLRGIARKVLKGIRNGQGKLSIQETRVYMSELDDVISSGSSNNSVKHVATELARDLRSGMGTAAPELAQANKVYSNTIDVLDRNKKLLMAEGDTRVMNPEKIQKFHTAHAEQQNALAELNALPGSNNFLPDVKDVALANETYSFMPRSKGISLMGGGYAAYKLMQGDPGMATAVAMGLAASSPRLAAMAYKYPNLLANKVAAMTAKPMGHAIADIIEKFGLPSRAAGAAAASFMENQNR